MNFKHSQKRPHPYEEPWNQWNHWRNHSTKPAISQFVSFPKQRTCQTLQFFIASTTETASLSRGSPASHRFESSSSVLRHCRPGVTPSFAVLRWREKHMRRSARNWNFKTCSTSSAETIVEYLPLPGLCFSVWLDWRWRCFHQMTSFGRLHRRQGYQKTPELYLS